MQEIYETTGPDGATYRVVEVNDTVTHGPGGAPTSSEQSFDVLVASGRGAYYSASQVFFQYALSRRPCDAWGNPIANNGVELREVEDGLQQLWRGHIRWEFPSVESRISGDVGGDDYYAPFISAFSCGKGERHVTCSYFTRRYNITGVAPDFGGGIGWNGQEFLGVDITHPTVTFEVTARTPSRLVENFGAFLNRVVSYVGTVNIQPFFGCRPGTILFTGITSGSLKLRKTESGENDPYWEMSYSFAASPNRSIPIGGVPVYKSGWEYLWPLVDPETNTVKAAYVEQVYQYADLTELGFGG